MDTTASKGHTSIRMSSSTMIEGVGAMDGFDSDYVSEQNSWANIIFLPFEPYWKYIIVTTTIFNFGMNSMDFIFKLRDTYVHTCLYYSFEILYLVDTAALFFHQRMVQLRKTRYHQPVSTAILCLSILSLLPYFETYYLLNVYTWDYRKPFDTTRIKVGIRLIPVFIYFANKKRDVGVHQIVMIVINQILILLLIITFLSCIWYTLGNEKESTDDWTIYLRPYEYLSNNTVHWMILCAHITGTFFAHNTIGHIFGVTVLEKMFLIVILISGFTLHYMVFFGELTGGFIQSYWHLYQYTTRLKKIVYLLDDWHVDKEVRKKTIEYYNVFWERRLGIRNMPEALELLPISMRKDVTVDIFWEAFRHSHIFVGTKMPFKRSISMVMKTDFLLPGDYLFRAGQLKTKMVYIVSGVLQILTDEDNESPILSLSSGTLLGEASCLRAIVSGANVRCATYCELHTLDLVDVYKVLVDDANISTYLLQCLNTRIMNAKTIRADVREMRRALNANEHETSIKRLKKQWRIISALHANKKRQTESMWKKLDLTFTSQYLDMIVLSQEVELKVQAICLTSQCPLIMDPNSSFRAFCEYLTIASTCVQFLIVPYYVVFENKTGRSMQTIFLFLDALYYLDIYVQLSTAVKVKDKLISNSRDIVLYRLKQLSFLIDVFCSLPYWSLIGFIKSTDYSILGQLPRTIKIYKVFILINEKEKNLWTDNVYMRFIKYIVLSVIFLYSSTCALFALSCFGGKCKERSWFTASGYKYGTSGHNLIVSHLYGTVIYLGHGLNREPGYLMVDVVVITMIIFLGYFMYSFMFSELTATAVLQVKKVYAHQDEMLVVKNIMKHRLVGAELYSSFIHILDFNWRYNEDAQIKGSSGILNDVSEELKTKIINERIASVLKQVPLFNVFSDELIRCMSMHMRVTILPEDTPLIEVGATVLTVYVILRGYCSMVSDLPGDRERGIKVTLKKGDILAPVELLHRMYSVTTIVTETAVEIMQMPYDTFRDILRSHRSEYLFVQQTLQEHLNLYNNLLKKKSCRLWELRSAKPSHGKPDSFDYKILRQKNERVKDEYLKPIKEKQWSFIRYVLLRRTIDPKTTLFLIWEACRSTVIVVDVLATVLSINIPAAYYVYPDYIVASSRVMAGVDVYLRLHCQYYNEKGILVTHSLYTAKHYLSRSFIIDLMGALPMTLVSVAKLFGTNYETRTKGIIRLLTRPIQLYRPLSVLHYCESELHWSKASMLMKLRYSIVTGAILCICANFLLLFTCRFTSEGMDCFGENWLEKSPLEEPYKNWYVMSIQSVYLTLAIYANTLTGAYKAITENEMLFFTVMVFCLHMFRTAIVAKFTSSTVGGNINLSIYQARMKQFLKFAKEVRLEEKLIKETVAHNEYVWKETQGTSIVKVCSKLNLYLRVKFVCFLYEDTLRSTSLFVHLSPYSLRRLALSLEEVHFKKDAHIIRCNDVQTKLYIVYKGKVDVIVANVVISTLEAGGIFGCFSRVGVLRQTLSVVAKMHTIVLAIDSKEFHKVMIPWENEQARNVMRDIKLLKLEYLEPFVNTREMRESYIAKNGFARCYQWLIITVNKYVNQESFWFWLWKYMMNVHISVISSLVVLIYMCWATSTPWSVRIFIYFIDILYLSNIFFGFTLQYVDVSTGIVETEPKKIMVVYLKRWFWFDLFTCVPFEIPVGFIWAKYETYGSSNRILRYFYLVYYYNVCNYKLNISKHLRWTYLIYKTLFNMQFMVNIWMFFTCPENYCHYNDWNGELIQANTSIHSIIAAYGYIGNMFTSATLTYVSPYTITELSVAMFLIILTQYVIPALASGFVTLIIIENTILSNYKYSIQKLNNYLKSHHLSQAILNIVWGYLLQLWKIQRGEWMPMLIHNAPAYLQQDIMNYLYMSHLENHFLFAKTHKDFLRQLVVHLERCIYFPGNYIVAQGDMDNTMYFIHKGEVGAYVTSNNKEIHMHTLRTNMTFGEAQGLKLMPYHLSYKAISIVEVLALRKNSWQYLLTWFPASYEEVKKRTEEWGLVSDSTPVGKAEF